MAKTVEAIDNELEKYYAAMGDNSYRDADGRGKFLAYYIDNEYDEDEVQDELADGVSYDDCSYLDFDEDFPFGDNNPKNGEEEIFKILQKIYLTGTFLNLTKPTKPTKTMFDLDYVITPNDIKEAIIMCRKQMPFIGNDGFSDKILMKFVAIGIKNKIPLLSTIVDSYNRDRVIAKVTHGKVPDASAWPDQCKHLAKFQSTNKKIADELFSSIKSYTFRIAPKLQLEVVRKIDDSLKEISLYIAMFSAMVYARLQQEKAAPFHMDFVIAAKNPSHDATTIAEPEFSDDEDADGDGDDNDDSVDNDNLDQGKELPEQKELGDFLREESECMLFPLKNNPIQHLKEDLFGDDNKNDDDFKLNAFVRKVDEFSRYKEFTEQLKKNKELKIDQNFPHRRRLCAFVDRRDDKYDRFAWYFSKKEKFNEMAPKPHAPESFLGASRECKFGVLDSYNGQTITVSFHVEQEDEVRCYLFWNGQQIRFYPQDIIDLLPLLFVENNENKEFAKSKEAIQIAKSMQIRDHVFESFYGSMHPKEKFPKY